MRIVRLDANESALRRGQSLTRSLAEMLQSLFCRSGPVCRQSFSDGATLKALAKASYTIRSFVDSAVALTTGLCGM